MANIRALARTYNSSSTTVPASNVLTYLPATATVAYTNTGTTEVLLKSIALYNSDGTNAGAAALYILPAAAGVASGAIVPGVFGSSNQVFSSGTLAVGTMQTTTLNLVLAPGDVVAWRSTGVSVLLTAQLNGVDGLGGALQGAFAQL